MRELIFIVIIAIGVVIPAILIYCISKWGLKKVKLGNDKNRKYFAIIPSVLLTPLVTIGMSKLLFTLFIIAMLYYPTKGFDAEEWKNNPKERYTMSDDVVNSKILIGKTRDEVILLLGNDFRESGDNQIEYHMGYVPDGVLGSDLLILDINFEDNQVSWVRSYGR